MSIRDAARIAALEARVLGPATKVEELAQAPEAKQEPGPALGPVHMKSRKEKR